MTKNYSKNKNKIVKKSLQLKAVFEIFFLTIQNNIVTMTTELFP